MSSDKRLLEIFRDVHRGLPRQGPGSDQETLRALAACTELPAAPDILDVGCGPGAQTMALAKATAGHVTAVDVYDEYLDEVRRRAAAEAVTDRVTVARGDMMDLPFAPASFDLIWAEGAAYIMGFERAFARWRPLLRPSGCVAVTELTWLVPEPPAEAARFFGGEYPQMTDVETNVESIRVAGYEVIDHFTLPEAAWWDEYYAPLEARLPGLREQHADDALALAIIDATAEEIRMRRDHGAAYGYVFYVARART